MKRMILLTMLVGCGTTTTKKIGSYDKAIDVECEMLEVHPVDGDDQYPRKICLNDQEDIVTALKAGYLLTQAGKYRVEHSGGDIWIFEKNNAVLILTRM
jgi:hypothetical protein